ncbi:MAG: sulfatase-like hydrolase/transferase [Planctomycetota bacterium]|jgi:hypothetical protein
MNLLSIRGLARLIGRPIAFHPLLFAVFPILFLFSHNLGDYRITEILGLMAQTSALALVTWAGLALLLRNAAKAALILSLFAVLFFSHGHITDLLSEAGIDGLWPGWRASTSVITASVAVLAVGLYFIARARGPLGSLTRVLNVSAAFLVVVPTVRIAVYEIGALRVRRERAMARGAPVKIERPQNPRSIYYIILDSYGRSDNLKELYGHDNTVLLDFLKAKGFFVAERSHSNYPLTESSLASSLNFEYLNDPSGKSYDGDRVPLTDMIADSTVANLLKGVGYRYITFDPNGFVRNADVYMPPRRNGGFRRGLINTTAAAQAERKRAARRERILHAFENLPETAKSQSPVFVCAHILAPHPPFVFTSDGGDPAYERFSGTGAGNSILREGEATRGEFIKGYREQIEYVDKLVMTMVEGILQNSRTPPIIVLQGDHGPAAFTHPERMGATYLQDTTSILNAYYLPDGGDRLLYDSITPVNTFRIIFRHYFNADCELLGDRVYFAPPGRPWETVNVTDRIGSDEDRAVRDLLISIDFWPTAGT